MQSQLWWNFSVQRETFCQYHDKLKPPWETDASFSFEPLAIQNSRLICIHHQWELRQSLCPRRLTKHGANMEGPLWTFRRFYIPEGGRLRSRGPDVICSGSEGQGLINWTGQILWTSFTLESFFFNVLMLLNRKAWSLVAFQPRIFFWKPWNSTVLDNFLSALRQA